MKKIISKILRKKGYVITKIHGYPRSMIQFLESLNQHNLVGVEIGVYQGGNAESILETLDINKLILVDPYEEYDEHTLIKRAKDNNTTAQKILNDAKKQTQDRLKNFKNVSFVYEKSEAAVTNFEDESFDFIYIDANHSYESVKQDIELWFPKVKRGGIIGGDDFQNGFVPELNGCVNAILEFVSKNELQLYNDGKDWWVIK